jgi:hypothetical protein
MLKRILAGVILALILTGGAVAGPFEEGDAAYQRATMRVRLWRPLAEQGNATAQFRGPVGRCRGSQVVSSPRRVGAPGRPPLEEESQAWVSVPLPFPSFTGHILRNVPDGRERPFHWPRRKSGYHQVTNSASPPASTAINRMSTSMRSLRQSGLRLR